MSQAMIVVDLSVQNVLRFDKRVKGCVNKILKTNRHTPFWHFKIECKDQMEKPPLLALSEPTSHI